MTFAENRTYGVPEFAETEVNRHSGKLKGLSGYLQMVGDKTQQTSKITDVFTKIVFCKRWSSSLQVFLNVITSNSEASQVIQSKETA